MQTEDIKDLATALAKAQAEIEGASKSAANPHFKSKYADLASVWDACRGPLTKHGLSIIQQPRAYENQLRLVTRVMHQSGQWIEDEGFPLMLTKQDMQGLGSATTYARRYGLMAAVGIAPEDDDGNAASVAVGNGKPSEPVRAVSKNHGEARGPLGITALKDKLKAFVGDLEACSDYDELIGLLNHKDTMAILSQGDRDLRGWMDTKEGSDILGIHDRIRTRREALSTEADEQQLRGGVA